MNSKKNNISYLYLLNLTIVIVVILAQIIIRSIIVVEVNYEVGKKIIVEAQKYYEYFDLLNLVTVIVITVLILNTFLYLTNINKYNERRLKILTGLFNQRELNKVEEISSVLSASDITIIDAWNRSIDEIINQTNKRETYFSQMVHDLNTPIQLLKMNSEMNKALNKSEYADAIDDEINELENKITNYLMVEKISYFEKPNLQDVELVSYVKEMENRFKILKMNLILDFEIEPIVWKSDRRMLDKIFQNLIENAIKYSATNELKISLSNHQITIVNKVVGDCNVGDIFAQESRRYSSTGNGLGSEIIKTYAELLNLNIKSEVVDSNFSVIIRKDRELYL